MKKINQYFGFLVAGLLFPLASFAEEGAAAAGHATQWIGVGAGLGIAIAAFGAALGQGRIASAFMIGTSRNPGAVNQMRTPLILSLIFVETLVLFTVLIELMLVGKI